eukprot:11496541-Heterocapsa_arctica.AAC.1
MEWWYCTACEAKGPNVNNQFCSSYTHKGWTNADSDHSDNDSENKVPGHKVRKEAYNIMVGNHKDNIFQQKEATEANRLRTTRELEHTKDNS